MFEASTGTGKIVGRASRLRKAPSCRNGYPELGHVGKKILKKILELILQPIRLLLCGLLLAAVVGGCEGDQGEHLQSGRVLALQGLQGRWVGPVVPTDGACGSPTHGVMSIGRKGFGFDPFQGATVVLGKVDEDGHLSGVLVRQSPDHRDISIAFEGTAAGSDAIEGTLQSGRCRWKVALRRG